MDFQKYQLMCRSVRGSYSRLFHGVPESFNFVNGGEKLLFLAAGAEGTNSLHTAKLTQGASKNWQQVSSSGAPRELTRSEQLLRERMRATGRGITAYEYLNDEDLLLIQDGPKCTVLQREQESVLSAFPEFPGALDYKLSPSNHLLVACVYEGDVWLLDSQTARSHQLTHTAADRKQTKLTAGQPSFIIQEEFDRYTGFWWQPQRSDDGVCRILYEEVDESRVGVVHTFNPSKQEVENYNYPRPGTTNASSTLKMLEVRLSEEREVSVSTRTMAWPFEKCFPQGTEYIVSAGWMPQGNSIWVQLLDRKQTQLKLVVVDLEAFVGETTSPDDEATPPDDQPRPVPYILWEEKSDVWINVSKILKFLPPSLLPSSAPGFVSLVISSEVTGFRHLYLVEATPPPPARVKPPSGGNDDVIAAPRAEVKVRQLTSGEWVVLEATNTPHGVWLDEARRLVYFEANATTYLEKHLYAVSLESDQPCSSPVPLTTPGFYHSVTMDTSCDRFVSVYSSPAHSAVSSVFAISHAPLRVELLCTIHTGPELPKDYSPPTRFEFACETGEELVGVAYPPTKRHDPAKKHPVVLFVYGGPHVQVVTNGLSRFLPRIMQWTSFGCAVVVIDNRGSANRGLKFEAHLKGSMGEVEVTDQVAGLLKAADCVDYLDLQRVAVTGWSYGGYMALQCLARFPDVFSVAIAGAPVTDWMCYDTGYTERYLGVPPEADEAYKKSSVLNLTDQFPNQPNRLLIIHGMNDENVLFTHSSLLVDDLVARGKPYRLQVYTSERHGLRSREAAIHCDATVLDFLLSYL